MVDDIYAHYTRLPPSLRCLAGVSSSSRPVGRREGGGRRVVAPHLDGGL